ncbi:hypothetical protein [Nioella aestuarii]|uniref:hypothetical protein n=1 Tax=Nioella aestuarii TaxID=1662864 RepID=UPI003D7F358F
MRYDPKSILTAFAILVGLAVPHPVVAQEFTDRPVIGLVEIEQVHTGTLLQLRGMAGRGQATLRLSERDRCITIPLRFVAGDFGGRAPTRHPTGLVRLALLEPALVRAMVNGQDIVSDMFAVGTESTSNSDIRILSGIEESFGFVLNPGLNIWAEIFGPRSVPSSCEPLDQLADQPLVDAL